MALSFTSLLVFAVGVTSALRASVSRAARSSYLKPSGSQVELNLTTKLTHQPSQIPEWFPFISYETAEVCASFLQTIHT